MKELVLYYSLEGNTRLIADTISKTAGADLLELKPKKPIPSGFLKFVVGGKQVVFKDNPPIEPVKINPNDYDLIYIGTPVWAGSFAPALRTFLKDTVIKNKKIALFCCYSGSKGKTFEEFKNALDGNTFVSEIEFADPAKKDTDNNIARAREWVSIVKSKLENS